MRSQHCALVDLPQTHLEAIFEDVLRQAGVTVERGRGGETVKPGDGRVVSVLKGPEGSTQKVESRIVVGCDGWYSRARDPVGIRLRSSGPSRRFSVADGRLWSELGTDTWHVFCHRDGGLGLHPWGGDRWRLIAEIRAEAEPPQGASDWTDLLLDRAELPVEVVDLE